MSDKVTMPAAFGLEAIGNISLGRPNLGEATSVTAYRLMQYSLRDALLRRFGEETTREIFTAAGKAAGAAFCGVVDRNAELPGFLADLQKKLRELQIGILRIEKIDLEEMAITLTVSEDLDCSGRPAADETVCDYDEGFIAGLLGAYTGKDFVVREVDCWAAGGRTCRFEVRLSGACT